MTDTQLSWVPFFIHKEQGLTFSQAECETLQGKQAWLVSVIDVAKWNYLIQEQCGERMREISDKKELNLKSWFIHKLNLIWSVIFYFQHFLF